MVRNEINKIILWLCKNENIHILFNDWSFEFWISAKSKKFGKCPPQEHSQKFVPIWLAVSEKMLMYDAH